MKKTITLFLVLIFFFSACSQSNEIAVDLECEQRALEKIPTQVRLSFEKAFNGYDDKELYYVLNSLTWADGHNNIIDRAFRKPTIVGLDPNYYYPIDKKTKLDDSWDHSEDIQYLKNTNGVYAQYRYELVLESTDQIILEKKENQLSGIPEDDTTKGTRIFNVVNAKVIFCGDDQL